ncbi:hypothetical protein B0H14DRAFT_3158095 [Mycena olivaceomarginata]|nr:hypothetical protein B0H14DRAFT_3158095 [Mycena olivaceomarginata]
MFEEAADFTSGEIKAYRKFVFPDALAAPDHDPFFSVENAPSWITSLGFQLYLTYDDSGDSNSLWTSDIASTIQLKAYRNYILSDQYVGHSYFSLESSESWINPCPFEAYMLITYGSFEDYRGQHQDSTPCSSRAPSRAASSPAGSRASSRISFIPSSRASTPASFATSDVMSRPASAMSIYSSIDGLESDEDFPDPRDLLTTSPVPAQSASPPLEHQASEGLSPRPKGKGKGKLRGSIKLTRQDSSVESTWSVPRTPTAIRVDLSQSMDKLSVSNGRFLTLDAFIRSEDQDSWGGSSGHTKGDGKVFGFFPEDLGKAIECRRCQFPCNGIDACQLLDPNLFAGCERFTPDMEGMQELWHRELDSNEQEAESATAIIARFYTRIVHSKCKIKCDGLPMLVRLANDNHRYWPIPHNVNESDLQFVLEHDGFSHVVDGKIIPASMQSRQCPTEMIVFIPVEAEKTPATRYKALVILRNAHNHPMHPKIKPSSEDRVKLGTAVRAFGLTGLTPMRLLNAPSTSIVYDGHQVAEESPAFTDTRKVRDFISAEKRKEHPQGLGWDGVLYRMTKEIQLVKSEQYIHTVMNKNGWKLVVTLHPQIVMHIHRILYLVIDYTFKRIEGSMDEWEVVGFLDRAQRRVTFGSLYCDTKKTEAFEQLFTELFATVKNITEAKCRIIMLDGEVAQALGLGDFLVKYNDPNISGIYTRNPLKLLSSCLKKLAPTILNGNELRVNRISKAIILKTQIDHVAHTQEEIDEWHRFAAAQTHPAIHKMANPWILPSVNKLLSKISNNNWDITPNHSNLVETAHAGRNAETAIGSSTSHGDYAVCFHVNCLSQFSVLNRAQERDNIIAAELNRLDQNGVMRHRFNGSAEREKLSAQRKVWNMRKTAARNNHITGYEELKAERENGLLENKGIARARGHPPSAELNEVRTEIEQENSGRREWVLCRAELDRQINELRSGPLAGTRINGRRPTERPTGEIEPLAPSTQDVTRNMMDERVVDDSNLLPTAEYEEPVNELEYAGPIYEPDSFGVPMEYPPNLDAGPVDFSSDVLVNSIESAAGLDDFNMGDFFPNFDPQAFDFGSTYDLPGPLPAPPASSPPTPVVTEGMQSTRKRKTREPEVDVRDIIPEGQGRARFRARVRAEGLE